MDALYILTQQYSWYRIYASPMLHLLHWVGGRLLGCHGVCSLVNSTSIGVVRSVTQS